MPFNYPAAGLGAWSQPPRGLGFGDLYRPTPRPIYPAEPDWIDSARELPEEERRRLLRESIARFAMAFGQGASNGRIGSALAAGALEGEEAERRVLAAARARQEEDYGRARYLADQEFAGRQFQASEEERATKIRALISMRDQVVAADPALRQRAEAALAAQDGAALRNLLGSLPEREAYRARGLEPDSPFAQRQAELDMQTAEEAERRKAELADLPRELELRSGANIEEEKRKRALGLGSYYTSPAELMNAQAEQKPILRETGETLWQIGPERDPITGLYVKRELARAKEKAGKLQLVRDAYGYGRHGKFNPDTGQVTPVTMEEWKDLKAGAEAAKVPPNAPVVRKPAKAPKGSADPSGFAPRKSQVTNPQNAPAGPGGTLRPAPLARPGVKAQSLNPSEQQVQQKLESVQAQTGELPADALRIAVQLLSEGKSPEEVARLVREARGY